MFGSRNRVGLRRWLGLSGAVCGLVILVGVSISAAQFGIPKIKVPKIGKSSPVNKVEQGPAPEVSAINPSSVPPGWEGDVVFTGKNFAEKMKLRMECGNLKPEDFRVETAERAVFHLKVPPEAEDTKCLIALEVPPGGATAEIGPAAEGTPQIVQVTGANFAISSSSTLAVARSACLMGEGKIEGYEGFLNAQIEFQKQFQTNPHFMEDCRMFVSPDSVKYVQGEKTIFDRPASAVKKVEKVVIDTPFGDQPTEVFSITWTDGKVQNFMGTNKDGAPASQAYDELKQKLKK